MKKILILILLINTSINAQVKGNKKIETRIFSVENLQELEVGLYAKITINQSLKQGMTITTDANLFDKIDLEIVDGKLKLNQKEWIQPSKKIKISIGGVNFKRIQTATHETLILKNVNSADLNLVALLGKIKASGKIKQLNIDIENGTIDASKLIAKNARVNIWGRGKAIVFAENEVFSILKENARLALVNTPKLLTGDTKRAIKKNKKNENLAISWINFKLKNNSWNRNHLYVVGPKRNGNTFSYGFPMMPGSKRKEKWSVGTRVYQVNKLGLKKLLVTITKKDEGKTVNLF